MFAILQSNISKQVTRDSTTRFFHSTGCGCMLLNFNFSFISIIVTILSGPGETIFFKSWYLFSWRFSYLVFPAVSFCTNPKSCFFYEQAALVVFSLFKRDMLSCIWATDAIPSPPQRYTETLEHIVFQSASVDYSAVCLFLNFFYKCFFKMDTRIYGNRFDQFTDKSLLRD